MYIEAFFFFCVANLWMCRALLDIEWFVQVMIVSHKLK